MGDKVHGEELQLDEITEQDALHMTFDSVEDAETFYNRYARVKGFSVRRDNMYTDKNQLVVSRRWVCSKEGQRRAKDLEQQDRIREPKQLTRVSCLVAFNIKFNRSTGKYVVKEFGVNHSHDLIGPLGVNFLLSHRNVTSADKATVNPMHQVGIGTSRIFYYMAEQSGGYEKVGFTDKDLHNHFFNERMTEIVDGDAEVTLAYLCAKFDQDPMFYYKYDADEEQRLKNLFWTDSTSRTDFHSFGDVLLFDATYKTNAYKKSFVILQGVNHHFQTVIFGCALLASETTDAYIWVLEAFLEAMHGQKPLSVITDGDVAMRNAIRTVLPNAQHRLCVWHLKKNAVSHVHKSGFLAAFEGCMSRQCTQEEFELQWQQVVGDYELHNNRWAAEVYLKRTLWAEAYLKGQFFTGARSTQRCESMNAYLKRFLELKLRLVQFVRAYDRALAKLRYTEAKAQTETENSSPVLSTGVKKIEKHAAAIYTRALFYKFREEIRCEQSLWLVDRVLMGEIRKYYFAQYQTPLYTWTVEYHLSDSVMKCSCLKFESIGIPCSHMVAVMKIENLNEIPKGCILHRWTKSAKTSLLCGTTPIPQWVMQTTRFGALSSQCTEMCYYAAQLKQGSYEETRNEVTNLSSRVKGLYIMQYEEQKGMERDIDAPGTSTRFGVGDPPITKGKGSDYASKKMAKTIRKCTICRGPGHMRNNCPNRAGEVAVDMGEDRYTTVDANAYAYPGTSERGGTAEDSFTGRDSYTNANGYPSYNLCENSTSVDPTLSGMWWTNSGSVLAQWTGTYINPNGSL